MLARKRHIKHAKHKRQKQKHKAKKSAHLSLVPTVKKPRPIKQSSTSRIASLLESVMQLGVAAATMATAAATDVTLIDPLGRIYATSYDRKPDLLLDSAKEKGFILQEIMANLTGFPQQLVADYKCQAGGGVYTPDNDGFIHIVQNGSAALNIYGEWLSLELNNDQENCNERGTIDGTFLAVLIWLGVVLGLASIGALTALSVHLCRRSEYTAVATKEPDNVNPVQQQTDVEAGKSNYQTGETNSKVGSINIEDASINRGRTNASP